MGSAAPAAVAELEPATEPIAEVAVAEAEPAPQAEGSPIASVREAILRDLESAGHRMLAGMLESGEWIVEGNDLVIKVAASATVIDMSVGADAKRTITAIASGVLGRALRIKVLPGQAAQTPAPRNGSPAIGGRGRAEQDPIVRRMKEKFGAEIRTIIDHKQR
jgi:hypothetical protein